MNDNRDLSFQSTKRQDRILPEDSFGDWKWREGLAESMIPIIGGLYRNGINILIYGKSLVNLSPVEIMKAHRFARQADNNELSELETFPILEYINSLNIADCEIDVGELAIKFPNFSEIKMICLGYVFKMKISITKYSIYCNHLFKVMTDHHFFTNTHTTM